MGLKVTKKSQRTHPSLLSEHFQKGGRVVTYQTRAAMGNVRIFWPTLTHVYNGWIRSNGYTVANRKTSWTNPVPLLLECIFWLSPFRFERDRFIKRTSTFIQIYYVYIKNIYILRLLVGHSRFQIKGIMFRGSIFSRGIWTYHSDLPNLPQISGVKKQKNIINS